MSDRPVEVYPGPGFWDELRRELARTEIVTLERFDRVELPWVLDRFRTFWDDLLPVLDEFPQRRFASFVSADGYRFTVDGWMHTSGRIELWRSRSSPGSGPTPASSSAPTALPQGPSATEQSEQQPTIPSG